MNDPGPSTKLNRRRWWSLLKLLLFVIVAVVVGRQGWTLWNSVDRGKIGISYGWLLIAAPVSMIGWIPSLDFWRTLMAALGERVSWRDAARAYYAGHLGKYAPGKALALVLRAGMLQGRGATAGTAALTAAYETTITISAGVCTMVMLLPWVITHDQASRWHLPLPDTVKGRCLISLGTLVFHLVLWHGVSSFVLRYFQKRLLARGQTPDFSEKFGLLRISMSQTVGGFLQLICGWWIHGLSLGLTICSLSGNFSWQEWPLWTTANAVAMVGGFLAVFAPAGLMVREGLMYEMLAPHIGEQQALLVAILSRAVNLAGEILVSVCLYYIPQQRVREGEG